MNLKEQVKNGLRIGGHALGITIHDRLNGIESALQQILEQNTHLATTQTALLQSGLHLVESVERLLQGLERVQTAIAEQRNHIPTQIKVDTITRADFRAIMSALSTLSDHCAHHQDFQVLHGKLAQLQHLLSGPLQDSLSANIEAISANKNAIHAVDGKIDRLQTAGMASIHAGIQTMAGLSDAMRNHTVASLAVLEPAAQQTTEFLATQSLRQVCVSTSDHLSTHPELGLLEFLYSFLPSRTALDVGAHTGDVSEHLLKTGYEVYAFEPYPPTYQRLIERLSKHPDFHGFNLALGSVTGQSPLYTCRTLPAESGRTVTNNSADSLYEDPTVFHSLMRHGLPSDLPFGNAVQVNIRRLAELHTEHVIPANPALLKIDTEGYDLEVIRGMQEHRYPVVMVEFWDENIPLASQGLLYTAESMAQEMRHRGYMWYIVIYRVWGRSETAFFCNSGRSIPNSWGNMVFFQDREVFAQAQQWCSAVLPRTYFRHVTVRAQCAG